MWQKLGIPVLVAALLVMSCPVLSFSQGETADNRTSGAAPPEREAGAAPETMTPTPGESIEGGYLIGPGDVLDIYVWKDEALTRSCVVRPDGVISFPLIGEVSAGGKTVARLKRELEDRLVRFVPDLTLSLEVKQVNSLIVYVIGKVNTPGRLIVNTDINVLQALATAAGLNPFAKRDKIKIFRQSGHGTATFPFNYDQVVDGEHLEQNIRLQRGDVIVVP